MTPKLGPQDQAPSRPHPPYGKVRRWRKEEGFPVENVLAHLGAAGVKMKVPV